MAKTTITLNFDSEKEAAEFMSRSSLNMVEYKHHIISEMMSDIKNLFLIETLSHSQKITIKATIIKALRERLGLGLKEAKDYFENHISWFC